MSPLDFLTIKDIYDLNVDINQADVESLKRWVEKQPHLPPISDEQLSLFLSSCSNSIEATKTCIDNYYTLRTLWPDLFSNRDPYLADNQKQLKTMLAVPLQQLTANKDIVFFVKFMDGNPAAFDLTGLLKLMDMSLSIMGLQRGPQHGFLLVVDAKEVGFSHFIKVNWMTIKRWFYFVQEALPVKMKAMHVINVNAITDKVLEMIKPFLSGDLLNQIYSHTNMESFYTFVDKDIMPVDYGGKEISQHELHAIQRKNIETHADYFIEEDNRKVDESKRQGKRTNLNEFFGVEGSFKQLSID